MSFLSAITPTETAETFDDDDDDDVDEPAGQSGSFSMSSRMNNDGSYM